MSPPAEKARPAPVITSARSSDGGSCDSCATEACTASPISTVMAFRLSGRSSVNTLTPLCSSSSTRTAVLSLRTAVLSFCTCGTARRQAACSRGNSLDERISMAATPVALKQRVARRALGETSEYGKDVYSRITFVAVFAHAFSPVSASRYGRRTLTSSLSLLQLRPVLGSAAGCLCSLWCDHPDLVRQ